MLSGLLPAVLTVALGGALGTACRRPADFALPAPDPGAPAAPGPAPRRRTFDAAFVNTQCEECHSEIAAEWRGSLHHASHTDPMYKDQLAKEPFPFCRACHAPEASPAGDGPEAAERLGVGCVTCHVTGDAILAVPRATGAEHDGEHHALTRSSALAGPAACGACHEFAFPDQARRTEPLLMQSTMTEHARGAHAADTCASCHMPLVRGATGTHRSHAFAASRDEALVRSAIVVEEGPFTDDTLVLRLRAGAVGHAFPTGDMLRRLALVIDVLDRDGQLVAREERYFTRHFAFTKTPYSVPRRALVRDDRIGAKDAPAEVTYRVRRSPEGGRLHYVLRYERVADPGSDGAPPIVEGSVRLAEGTKTLSRPPPTP